MKSEHNIFDTRSQLKATSQAYLTGLAGMTIFLLLGILSYHHEWFTRGIDLFFYRVPADRLQVSALVLLSGAFFMIVVELGLRRRREQTGFIQINPLLKEKKVFWFLFESFIDFLLHLLVLTLALKFYDTASEYSFLNENSYYRPWAVVLEMLYSLYLWAGLPYTVFTRALQHDGEADKKSVSTLVLVAGFRLLEKGDLKTRLNKPLLGTDADSDFSFNRSHKTALLSIFVKLFFAPLMTVFFFDQFKHLVNNLGFIEEKLSMLNEQGFIGLFSIADFYHISFSIIFSIDVGIAWAGYVFTMRWLKNSYVSVEPAFLGWAVALLCYPPFNGFLSEYYSTPSENAFFAIKTGYIVQPLAFIAVASYVIYMSATVVFGLRFSNLTHRGIITNGPYRLVRHPAYAAKNLAWWAVMFPFVLYDTFFLNHLHALTKVLGLLLMSYLYYWRAITEEKHLSDDIAYREYCEKVKYRFIPGII